MRFSDSINVDIPKPIKFANSDSSPFNTDTSSTEDGSSKTTYPVNPDTSLNDSLSFKTIIKTHDTNPSYTCTRHPADNHLIFSSYVFIISSNDIYFKSHDQLRQQPRKCYQLFFSPSENLEQ